MIFEFENYRNYLSHLCETNFSQKDLSEAINIQPTIMSMVISGKRDLSIEQALDLSFFLKLNPEESAYLIALVQFERSGTKRSKDYFSQDIKTRKKEYIKTANRFSHKKKLDEGVQAQFYSSWIYSTLRLYCSTFESGCSIIDIRKRFESSSKNIEEVLEFLLNHELIIKENGKYLMGPSRTYADKKSIHASRQHINWRLRALQNLDQMNDYEMMFTSPFSISKKDFIILREKISELINDFSTLVENSEAEEVACLNLDLFYVFPETDKSELK